VDALIIMDCPAKRAWGDRSIPEKREV